MQFSILSSRRWLFAGLVSTVFLAAALPGSAAGSPVEHVGHCNDPDRQKGNRPITNEGYVRMIAICGSRQMPGTPDFNEYWSRIAQLCAAGQPPTEFWDRTYNDRLVSAFDPKPSCERIEEVITTYAVPGVAGNIMSAGADAQTKKQKALELLRKEASEGSASAKFLLADRLLDIENQSLTYRPPGWEEAITTFGELAQTGHADAVYRFLADLRNRFPGDASDNPRHETFMFIYGQLAKANDPRGFVGLAEEFVRRARWSSERGNSEAASSELSQAQAYLQSARRYSTPETAPQIDKLEADIRQLEQGRITFAEVFIAIVALGALVAPGNVNVPPPQQQRIDPCEGSRAAVIMDPSLAAPVALFGCSPY